MKYDILFVVILLSILVVLAATKAYKEEAHKEIEVTEETTIERFYCIERFYWEPKEDITVYELAKLIPSFFLTKEGPAIFVSVDKGVEKLPEELRRHFSPVEDLTLTEKLQGWEVERVRAYWSDTEEIK